MQSTSSLESRKHNDIEEQIQEICNSHCRDKETKSVKNWAKKLISEYKKRRKKIDDVNIFVAEQCRKLKSELHKNHISKFSFKHPFWDEINTVLIEFANYFNHSIELQESNKPTKKEIVAEVQTQVRIFFDEIIKAEDEIYELQSQIENIAERLMSETESKIVISGEHKIYKLQLFFDEVARVYYELKELIAQLTAAERHFEERINSGASDTEIEDCRRTITEHLVEVKSRVRLDLSVAATNDMLEEIKLEIEVGIEEINQLLSDIDIYFANKLDDLKKCREAEGLPA